MWMTALSTCVWECVWVYNDSKWVISLTFAQSSVYYITSAQPLCSGSQALIFTSYLVTQGKTQPFIRTRTHAHPRRAKSLILRNKGRVFFFFWFTHTLTHSCSVLMPEWTPKINKNPREDLFNILNVSPGQQCIYMMSKQRLMRKLLLFLSIWTQIFIIKLD